MLEALATILAMFSLMVFMNNYMLEAIQKDSSGEVKPRHKSAD